MVIYHLLFIFADVGTHIMRPNV